MKEGWELKELGDFFEITSSKRVFKAEWKQKGIPFYRAREIVKLAQNGFVDNELFISDEMYQIYSLKYGVPKDGDLMVTGVGTLGICYVVKKDDVFYFKDGNIIWLKKKTNINSRFVDYAFKSDFLIKQIQNTVGATVGTYTIIRAKTTKIPVPSTYEQQRIVEILDAAFSKIDAVKQNAERNLQNAKELFQSVLDFELSPKEKWEEKKLSEVFNINPKKSEVRNILDDNDYVSFLPMEDLGICRKITKPNKEKLLKDVYSGYTYFAENDVLLAKVTPCFENGKLGIAKNLINNIGFGSSEYIVFRSLGYVLPEFLFYFLSKDSFRTIGANLMFGTSGLKRISKQYIEETIITYPHSISEQHQIVSKLDALSAKCKELKNNYLQTINDCDELKKAILAKAFNGEL